jgi:ADP-ribosylglycohydrolase
MPAHSRRHGLPGHGDPTHLAYADYRHRVHGGWLGKSIGGVIGARFENQKQWCEISADQLWPASMVANDDLDIQVLWLEALQERGVFLTHRDLTDLWFDRCSYNFCEYGHFMYNVQRGILPPLSGHWNNRFFRESEGCPIRAEIWGYICPGNPALAADYAQQDAELDHNGASVRIERFLAAAAADAVGGGDLSSALAAGCAVVPADCPEVRAIATVRAICDESVAPRQAWRRIIRIFGDRDASKAITNHALVLAAIFLGQGDFRRTIHLCASFGWDADCTAATAGALLGSLQGRQGLPADWVDRLGPDLFCGIPVKHRQAPLDLFTEETCRIGVEVAALRNPAVRLVGAPTVPLRPAPAAVPDISVTYPEAPVLWAGRPTSVRLAIRNPTRATVDGTLVIEAPRGVAINPDRLPVSVPPGTEQSVACVVTRSDPAAILADRNLFMARLGLPGGSLQRVFGLGGARQWLVYGPYWDMWDRARHAVCPYHNAERICHPGMAGCHGDSYNHFVALDRAYLDEDALLRTELPDEVPFVCEAGEDQLDEQDLGGFYGAACYYLVRTIQSSTPGPAWLAIGRCGPVRIWLDGRQIYERTGARCWAVFDEGADIVFTGAPQRLVVKLIRPSETGTFSLNVHRRHHTPGISSYLEDGLSDLSVGGRALWPGTRQCGKERR